MFLYCKHFGFHRLSCDDDDESDDNDSVDEDEPTIIMIINRSIAEHSND